MMDDFLHLKFQSVIQILYITDVCCIFLRLADNKALKREERSIYQWI